MIDHLTSIRQLASEVTSRLHLLSAHVRALRNSPAPPEPEPQARLWTDLELLVTQLRGLAEKLEQAGAGFERYPAKSELPSIEEMSGLIEDFTGGGPLKDYIEGIRNS